MIMATIEDQSDQREERSMSRQVVLGVWVVLFVVLVLLLNVDLWNPPSQGQIGTRSGLGRIGYIGGYGIAGPFVLAVVALIPAFGIAFIFKLFGTRQR